MAASYLSSALTRASASSSDDDDGRISTCCCVEAEFTRRAGRKFHVHNLVPHVEEVLTHEGLREEVSDVVGCRYERNSNFALFDTLPNKEVMSLDMLNPRVMFGIVGQVDSRLVVKLQRWSIRDGET